MIDIDDIMNPMRAWAASYDIFEPLLRFWLWNHQHEIIGRMMDQTLCWQLQNDIFNALQIPTTITVIPELCKLDIRIRNPIEWNKILLTGKVT